MSRPRRIDLPPYPTGWFAVASSADLAPGDVRPVRLQRAAGQQCLALLFRQIDQELRQGAG